MVVPNPNTPTNPRSVKFGRLIHFLPILGIIATLTLTALAYWPGLIGPLVFDDGPNLEPINDWLQGRVAWPSVVFGNDSGLLGRSLSMASFVLNVALLGPDAWGLKLGNLLLHLLNGALVFAVFTQLIRRRALTRDTSQFASWLPWLGASVWLLHPLLASTVLYVIQRMAMMSTLFTLLVVLVYLRGRLALDENRRPAAYWLLGFFVPLGTILAALSKENGVLAPALCAVIELVVFAPASGLRRPWQARTFIGAALLLPAVAAAILTVAQIPFITAGYQGRGFTLYERLLTESRVLWDYIGALLAPGGPRLGFYHDDFPISHSLLDPPTTLLAIVGWLVMISAAWRFRKVIPGLALGLGIFLVGHALESSVFPLVIYFEHRNYLPAIGGIWAIMSLVVFLADMARSKLRYASPIFGSAGLVLLLVLAAGTNVRAHVWADQRTMVAQAVLIHPNSKGARFDSIVLALAQQPPAFDQARADAEWMRKSPDPNTRSIGTIELALIECTAHGSVSASLVDEMFESVVGPFEEDLLHALELISDEIASKPCTGLSPLRMADGLAKLLDQRDISSPRHRSWRLRFRAANLYMAADRNRDAIKQARLAYESGTSPTNTSIMIAGLLIYNGDTESATKILDTVEKTLRPSDILAHKIVADDREKIRAAENLKHPPDAVSERQNQETSK